MSDNRYLINFLIFKNLKTMAINTKNVNAQSLGIDVSMETIDCCFCYQTQDRRIVIKGTRKFDNTKKGFEELSKWIKKWLLDGLELVIALEATGVYYENLAYSLSQNTEHKVCVLLPNTVKAFAKSLNVKSKTDKADAKILAQMALERHLQAWKAPSPESYKLKQLSRERETLLKDKTIISNRLHNKAYSHSVDPSLEKRLKKHYNLIVKLIKEVEEQLKVIVKNDSQLARNIERLTAIPGVGLFTAITVLCETNSFALFKSKAQVVSYVGLDVVENQSGISLKGKTRISKKGNSLLRKCLYFPAIVHVHQKSIYYDNFFNILQRTSCKMKAYVAVQRKLLVLMYSLVKNQTTFNPNYHTNPSISMQNIATES
jgi:transposase